MSIEVMQSFAKTFSDLVAAHDATNGTDFATFLIRPVLADLNAAREGVGMFLDNIVTAPYFGAEGARRRASCTL